MSTGLVQSLRQHGGRLSVARSLYPNAPGPWIDLSTGINPEPYPAPLASAAERARLPDPEQLKALEAAAGRAFGVKDPPRVLATAGSEAAIRLMPHVLQSETAVIPQPTYSSHADAWNKAGARVITAETAQGSTLTLVNPNNPDGCLTSRERVQEIHDYIAAREGHLVVDEAFADVTPEHSVADLAGTPRFRRLIVLRSFGKFYGLAGVRLGFVIAAPSLLARFHDLLGDWPVSADAISAGLAAYADTEWATRTRERLQLSAQRLDALLIQNGLEIVGGTSLFRLARCPSAEGRFERLLQSGILVRPFDYDATLLRFGLPADESAWQRLAAALRFT